MTDIALVDPIDLNKENSPIAGPIHEEQTVMLHTAKHTCMWNGATFNEGAQVQDGDCVYECSYGQWVRQ